MTFSSEDIPPLEELEPMEFEVDDDVTIKIFHNLGEQVHAAIINWLARFEDHSAESFSAYVKEKRDKGYIDQWVLTEAEYLKALSDYKTKQQ